MTKQDILELEERAEGGEPAAELALDYIGRAPRMREQAEACKAKTKQLRKLRREMYRADFERLVAPVIERLRSMGNRLARAATEALKRAAGLKAFRVVPNAPLRERFLSLEKRGLVCATSVAKRAGLGKNVGGEFKPDSSWVQRLLGLREPAASTKRLKDGTPVTYRQAIATTIDYDLGVRLADALTMPYTEAGV